MEAVGLCEGSSAGPGSPYCLLSALLGLATPGPQFFLTVKWGEGPSYVLCRLEAYRKNGFTRISSKSGLGVQLLWRWKQGNCKFKALLGYGVRTYLKKLRASEMSK